MADLQDPLTFAVQDIVEGSPLLQTTKQFHPVATIKTMRNLPLETVWPMVSAYTSTVAFTADSMTKELTLMVYFPFPSEDGQRSGNTYDDQVAVLLETETYIDLLMDLVDWLIGKHKVDSGRKGGTGVPAYTFNLDGEATIFPQFWDEEGTKDELKNRNHDLVAVALTARFIGTRASLRPSKMIPKVAGTSRDEAVTG